VSLTLRDAPMRESREPGSGVDMMNSQFSRWLRQAMRRARRGQGLVEYALLLVLISIACIAILSALGTNIGILYSASNVMVAP
jgi:Flp pilus assembly pilin Flp